MRVPVWALSGAWAVACGSWATVVVGLLWGRGPAVELFAGSLVVMAAGLTWWSHRTARSNWDGRVLRIGLDAATGDLSATWEEQS